MQENNTNTEKPKIIVENSALTKVFMFGLGMIIGFSISFAGELIDSTMHLNGWGTIGGAVASLSFALRIQFSASRDTLKSTSTKYLVSSILISSIATIGIIEYLF